MNNYNVILASNEATVMDKYTPIQQNRKSYQSEAELEKDMIQRLRDQGYEYANIHNINDALKNLRACIEELNNISFSDSEWQRFLNDYILKKSDGIKEKTKTIQEDCIKTFTFDNCKVVNIKLIDKENIYANRVQVINQYETNGNYENRYDVTILINGLPLVHCELKRRGIAIKEAFNQIERYQRDSFWADNGLFEYIQIFVISNGTETKYYSNTTRMDVVDKHNGKRNNTKTYSTSFDFTSFWADGSNNLIKDLVDFTKTFLAKQNLLNILTKYCVFTADEKLLVMRPYQIAAVEKILNKINIASNSNKFGTKEAGGYIWHTTGSGKTLTSFKTARLATKMNCVDKVLFVVDRNDLDYQTMKEYDKFEKGAANSNSNTKKLEEQLRDDTCKIIITTIQKLGVFVNKYKNHPIFKKNVVIIFDECHRSQFGMWHKEIVKHFKKYAIFGFTGTPIFSKNANDALKTTEQVFGNRLHTYTVVNAIGDKNVLPFRIDYYNTIKSNNADDSLIEGIDEEKILLAPKRVEKIVNYILTHFDRKTMRNADAYQFGVITNVSEMASYKEKYKDNNNDNKPKDDIKYRKRKGFNSILCTSSINAAKTYYAEFKKQMDETPELKRNIAIIYSYGVNNDNDNGILNDENSDDTSALSVPDRDFLDKAIKNYNAMFGTQYDTSSLLFPNYYRDLSLRMKNGEIDILIVVDMFLTGFDSKILNTLFVDKNLKQHGLIQAFSRTNRILNSVKAYGNIICFRDLKKEVDEAISLFGDKDASNIVLLKSYDYYHNKYKENIEPLKKEYKLPCNNMQYNCETFKKRFVNLFSSILRLQNILKSFNEFDEHDMLSEVEMQDYLSLYNDLYREYKNNNRTEKEDVSNDIIFEMELVRQIVVNVDYILALVAKLQKENHKCKKINIIDDIMRAINSNPELKPKKELIERFIEQINNTEDIYIAWVKFKNEEKNREFEQIVHEENLHIQETKELVTKMFRVGNCIITDAELSNIIKPMRRFGAGSINARMQRKHHINDRLTNFFMKYYD